MCYLALSWGALHRHSKCLSHFTSLFTAARAVSHFMTGFVELSVCHSQRACMCENLCETYITYRRIDTVTTGDYFR